MLQAVREMKKLYYWPVEQNTCNFKKLKCLQENNILKRYIIEMRNEVFKVYCAGLGKVRLGGDSCPFHFIGIESLTIGHKLFVRLR